LGQSQPLHPIAQPDEPAVDRARHTLHVVLIGECIAAFRRPFGGSYSQHHCALKTSSGAMTKSGAAGFWIRSEVVASR
jgi:hypothetical protein